MNTRCLTPFSFLAYLLISPLAHAGWGGTYMGANVGYGWNQSQMETKVSQQGSYFLDSDVTAIDAAGNTQYENSSNVLGGAQVGHRWQWDAWVFGFEFMVDSFDTNTTRTSSAGYPCCSPSTFTIKQTMETTWLMTFSPQFGYAHEDFLAYITAGLALTQLNSSGKFYDDFGRDAYEQSSHASTPAGWTIGVGGEYAFNPVWSVAGQYSYVNFGSISSTGTLHDTIGETARLKHEANLVSNTVRMAINYHF